MPLAGQYFDSVFHDAEHKPISFIDANAPPSRQIMAQRFRSPDTFITIAIDTLKQLVYAP